MKKNKITSIGFARSESAARSLMRINAGKDQIVISFKGKIPGIGYSATQIIKMLLDWNENRNAQTNK